MTPDPSTLPLNRRPLLALLTLDSSRSLSELGELLDVTKAAVHAWTRQGYLPAERVEQVADVLRLPLAVREELRRRARLDVRMGSVGRAALGGMSAGG